MKTKQGMTLIEIIVSIAIIALIAVSIIPAFGSNYKMIIHTRGLTKSTYSSQEDMEDIIEDIKDYIDTGDIKEESNAKTIEKDYEIFTTDGGGIDIKDYSSDGVNIDIKDFNKDVKIKDDDAEDGYVPIIFKLGNNNTTKKYVSAYNQTVPIKANDGSDSGKKLFTVVANTKRPKNTTPSQENTKVTMYNNANKEVMFAYATDNILRIDATFDAVKVGSPPKPVPVLKYLNRWYVSKSGFYIPQAEKPENTVEVGIKYPTFPNDYSIIAGAETQSLSTINESFAGKHVVYTITGASYSGVMGPYDVSANTIYFSGLPVTNNLFLHLDASLLDRYTKGADSYVNIENTGIIKVKGWNDISGNLSKNNVDENSRPIYNDYIFFKDGSDIPYKYVGSISFDNNDKAVMKSNYDIDVGCVFVIFNTNDTRTVDRSIVTSSKWSLGINANSALIFTYNGSSVSADSINVCDGKWHIAMINSSGLYVDGVFAASTSISGKMSKGEIVIGNGYVGNVGEVIGYKSITSDNIIKVEKYLKEKYSIE